MSQFFIKKVEDFACEHCGQWVVGSGFTNHCPNCLWSKHVDVFPGDRAGKCHGLMAPKQLIPSNRNWILVHLCQKCGQEKNNKIAQDDNIEGLLQDMIQ